MQNNIIFENIDEALNSILIEEKNSLKTDLRRQKPPIHIRPDLLNFLQPFSASEIIQSIIPYDNLDYPGAGFFNNAPMDKFIMSKLQSGRYSLKPNLRERGFVFRGENCYHDPNVPNMFRTKEQRFTCESVAYQELFLVILSHPLVQLLDLGINLDGHNCVFEVNLWGLTQHYYNKTALLDLTSDPHVASFFAVTHYDQATDTYHPITSTGEGVLYYYKLDVQTSFHMTEDHPLGNLNTIGLQIFPRSGAQKGFLLNMEKGQNFNDFAETNYVRFKHNADISQRIYKEFDGGRKLFPEDILQKHWINRENNTVSNKTMMYNQSRNQDYSLEELQNEVYEKGWTIRDYQPCFTSEELHSYYQDVKNGLWETFCNQIFIPGDTHGKMKEAMLNVEHNSEYSWAFQEDKHIQVDYKRGYLLKKFAPYL